MEFVITGTQAYGPITKDSDWDIVIMIEDALEFRKMLMILGIIVHESNHIHPSYKGYYFKFNHNDKVQIIIAEDIIEFNAWKEATKDMKKIPNIKDRKDRIGAFQQFFYTSLSKLRKQSKKDKLKLI